MSKNRFKTYKPKPSKAAKKRKKGFQFRYLLLSMLLGTVGGVSALWIAMSFRGVDMSIDWTRLSQGFAGLTGSITISTVTYYQQSKQRKTAINKTLPSRDEDLDAMLRRRRKNENYSDIHRYLN